MTVSILIPVYNAQDYIYDCLKSVVLQTYSDIEIIVINDGSTDNTQNILNNFKDERIKIITKINTGYGDSLNIGLKNASGEFISIIEADDTVKPDFIETLLKNIDNFEIIKSDFFFKTKNKIKKANITTDSITNCVTSPEIICLRPSIWSGLYRKDFLEKNNIIFNTTPGASFQDTSFNFKCFYFAKNIKFISYAGYFYTNDNPNQSINSDNKDIEIFIEFDAINCFFKTKNKALISKKILFEQKCYIWRYKRLKKDLKEDFILKAIKRLKKYDLEAFYKDNSIRFKDKVKLKILLENNIFTKLYLFIVK